MFVQDNLVFFAFMSMSDCSLGHKHHREHSENNRLDHADKEFEHQET